MLYKKHLTSLEDLQAERAAIKKKARKKARAAAKAEEQKPKGENPLEKGLSFLSGSLMGNSMLAPYVELVAKFGLPILLRKGAQFGVRKVIFKTAREVGMGYLKWKAISIAAHIIANKIKKKKEA